MTLTEIFLILSVIVNIVFIFYIRWLIKVLLTRDEDIININERLQAYLSHVKSINDLEVFYGDETLGGLLRHGTDLVEYMSKIDIIEQPDEEEINQELEDG
tara:strand:- start:901 stop:1203 length:303 start_codon:yes stop_codon:yes gene_type:complete